MIDLVKIVKNKLLAIPNFAGINGNLQKLPVLHFGLSGGYDSVVLTDILSKIYPRDKLIGVHIRHHLEVDEQVWQNYISELCENLQIKLQIIDGRVNPKNSQGMESAARKKRINAYFYSEAQFMCIATHGDDFAETLIQRILRSGCGSRSLALMQAVTIYKQDDKELQLVRPLLEVSKNQIIQYAKKHNLKAFEDPANYDPVRARSFVRHKLMPIVINRYPRFLENARKTSEIANNEHQLLKQLAAIDVDVNAEFLDRVKVVSLANIRVNNLLRFFIRAKLDEAGYRDSGLPSFSQLQNLTENIYQKNSGFVKLALVQKNENSPREFYAVIWQKSKIEIKVNPQLKKHFGDTGINVNSKNASINFAGGVLSWKMSDKIADGVSQKLVCELQLIVNTRKAGDVLKIDDNRPQKPLRKWMNELAVPEQVREFLPVVRVIKSVGATGKKNDDIVCCVGVGTNPDFRIGELGNEINNIGLVFEYNHPVFGKFFS